MPRQIITVYMIVANLRIKLKTICRQQGENRLLLYNVAHLKDEKVKTEFDLHLKNRFQALQQEDNVKDDWFRFKDTVNKAADSVVGRRREKRRERRISPNTWKITDERRVLKAKKEQSVTNIRQKYRSHPQGIQRKRQRSEEMLQTG